MESKAFRLPAWCCFPVSTMVIQPRRLEQQQRHKTSSNLGCCRCRLTPCRSAAATASPATMLISSGGVAPRLLTSSATRAPGPNRDAVAADAGAGAHRYISAAYVHLSAGAVRHQVTSCYQGSCSCSVTMVSIDDICCRQQMLSVWNASLSCCSRASQKRRLSPGCLQYEHES
jgi:hypothetical protein